MGAGSSINATHIDADVDVLSEGDHVKIKNIFGKVILIHGGSNLRGVDLTDAYLRRANFTNTDLTDAVLRRADLSYANLSNANISYVNLSNANISYANISYTNLRGANLRGADLTDANLCNTDLSHTDLTEADLTEVDLTRAILRDANLSYADLSYAILRRAVFSKAPVIPNIHKTLYDKCKNAGNLDMGRWHSGCGTTHCRAGWVVHLAGDEGYKLEKKLGTVGAALAIYAASDPSYFDENTAPDFYGDDNAFALKDMRRLAEKEKQNEK